MPRQRKCLEEPLFCRLLGSLGARRGLAAWEALAAVALLAAVSAGGYFLLRSGAGADQRSLTLQRMEAARGALERYALDNGGLFPSTRQGLAALVGPPAEGPAPVNWRGPYLSDPEQVQDGWGRAFRYIAPGAGDPPRPYDLWSLGADNQEGGEGPNADLLSWDRSTLLPAPP